MKFTTIILAGGRSTRMGENKACMPFRGKPLFRYPLDLALSLSSGIIISANDRQPEYDGFRVVSDILPVSAPLAGVHAGLKSSRTTWNLILSCDMPHLTNGLIERLTEALDDDLMLVIPGHEGFLEPLCAFYHRDLTPVIESNFRAGRISMLDLPVLVPHRIVELNDLTPAECAVIFTNLNEKKDLSG
jgi:molybdenum cofactor guanylyltransferase